MRADEIRWLYGYDSWAMRRILNAASGLTDEQGSAPSPLGGPSVHVLLVHILDAYFSWREGWRTGGNFPDLDVEGLDNLASIAARWREEEQRMRAFLAELSDEGINRIFAPAGVPLWRLMVHVVNHGTQHRAEVAALLTYYGCSPGDLDLSLYSRESSAPAA